MIRRGFITIISILTFLIASAQDMPRSVHHEQSMHYGQYGERPGAFYDSIHGFSGQMKSMEASGCQLQRKVFGFHTYWSGSAYLNYQWNLLSDLCYFSYEVNAADGNPVSIHNWLTDPAIDSAQAHGVKVHLCATIFSGHTAFFTNLKARQNLVTNLISLVQQRNADGVNMDIEAVPSSLGDSVISFMRDLSVQLKSVMPGAIISIDLPAVDWGNAFNITELDPYVDLFFIMGYDYYWNGSSQAGPVAPLYSLTSGYDYSLSRTISAYQDKGVSLEKFILGIPYYGRQWKTVSNTIPSQRLASGTALTYANVRNNPGTYNAASYHWEPNSSSSCYIFFQNSNWNQCFLGLDRDVRNWFDIVNYRGLGGTGMWALGYDNGYTELWQAISDKFTDCYVPLAFDTIYDSGGPTWNYYAFEDYIMTIDHGFNEMRYLAFSTLNLEEGYDSLWLYAGPDTSFSLLGIYSGQDGPLDFSSENGAFTLRFKSDGLQQTMGWMAVYHDGSLGYYNYQQGESSSSSIFPNPASGYINVILKQTSIKFNLCIYDSFGRLVYSRDMANDPADQSLVRIDVSDYSNGLYFVVVTDSEFRIQVLKFLKEGSD